MAINIDPKVFYEMGAGHFSAASQLGSSLLEQSKAAGTFQNQQQQNALAERELNEYKLPLGKSMQGYYDAAGSVTKDALEQSKIQAENTQLAFKSVWEELMAGKNSKDPKVKKATEKLLGNPAALQAHIQSRMSMNLGSLGGVSSSNDSTLDTIKAIGAMLKQQQSMP